MRVPAGLGRAGAGLGRARRPAARPGKAPVARTTRIEPWHGRVDVGELWRYRELLLLLAWRDVKVRYKQTVLGAAWAVLQPLLTMVVFTVIFGRLVGVPSDGVAYPVFVYTALLPWTFFAAALQRASASLVQESHLLSKVYFPRLLLPLASTGAVAVDLGIALVVLGGLMLVYGVAPGIELLALPVFVLLAFLTALGVGLWLSILYARYRDVGHLIPFLTQVWLFLTPVAYPSSLVPEGWRAVYGLNPMAGVVEGFRWALLGRPAPGGLLAVSAIAVVAVLVGGLLHFGRAEGELADVV
jgi:lipopolysaccharide transport system permease protein